MGKTKTAVIGESLDGTPGLKGGERVKMVDSETPQATDTSKDSDLIDESSKKIRKPKKRSSKYKENKSKVDKNKLYSIKEAIRLVKNTSYSTFNGAVELHLVCKKAGISTQIELPNSSGKQKKIEVADEDTVKKLENGKIDFDILLATPDMMPRLVPYAKTLGPKGLMPNPKSGTLIKDKKDAEKFSTNTVQIKTERKAPLIHITVGKVDMETDKIEENILAIINSINTRQIIKAYLTSTMGPSVKIKLD